MSSKITILIAKQVNNLAKNPSQDYQLIENFENSNELFVEMKGPIQTPFYEGIYKIKLVFPEEFPQQPPKGYFLTKIYHPNISETGEICVNSLKKDWDPKNWNIKTILEVIKCLLIIPFPESSLNEEAGKQFMENYSEYFKHAQMINNIHAKKQVQIDQKENQNDQINFQKMASISCPLNTFQNNSFQNMTEKQINKQEVEKKKWLKRI